MTITDFAPPTIIATPDSLANVLPFAKSVLGAKRALRAAESGWKQTEADGIVAFIANAVDTVLVPHPSGEGFDRITLEGRGEVRRTVSLEALAEMVTPEVLAKVTKPAIDVEAFDAAVEMGLIPAKVAEMVTTVKPVKATLRVTFDAKGVK